MVLVDNELALTPIAGKSGKAYMGTYPDGGRVFVKMNTTPILAGLAREQIASVESTLARWQCHEWTRVAFRCHFNA